eukprot:GILK01005858.1.p1 GENE.GILK01005858.1~~GILK01005858.1.p1  ORF type:complete len:764 (-),score=127.62 GILK01005858.1:137-2239(-)
MDAFFMPKASSKPVQIGAFVGDRQVGSSCNVDIVTLCPHGDGTHTECAGHVLKEKLSLSDLRITGGNSAALLLTAFGVRIGESGERYLAKHSEEDLVVTAKALDASYNTLLQQHGAILSSSTIPTLVIRTSESAVRVFSGTNPTYLTLDAAQWIVDHKFSHVCVDLPSVDKEDDQGMLQVHRILMGLPTRAEEDEIVTKEYIASLPTRAVTEMCRIPSDIEDGVFLASIQIAPFEMDAAPTRILLYRAVEEILPSHEFRADRDYAASLDAADPLASFRSRFHIPLMDSFSDETNQISKMPAVYLVGNSLGLQPIAVREKLNVELNRWANLGVEGHFGSAGWFSYHERFRLPVSQILGTRPDEVVVMNSLTVNCHLLMVSFYQPTPNRYKILMEGNAFPSDRYAIHSQVAFHGYSVDEAVVELFPREGESLLRSEDVIEYLNNHGSEVALVFIGAVNFYTGQVFDLEHIAKAAKAKGCYVGYDLAHAAGNIPLRLHDWEVDFAAFCSYKYLNSGPGAIAGAYVHIKHSQNADLPRFAGWWGNDPSNRFSMSHKFLPHVGADAWQLSNPPILAMAALEASLELFAEATIERLREKSLKLTGYFQYLLDGIKDELPLVPITPRDPQRRGCQISLKVQTDKLDVKILERELQKRGAICDVRTDVIRAAPVPLYNSFLDVWKFCQILKASVKASLKPTGPAPGQQ